MGNKGGGAHASASSHGKPPKIVGNPFALFNLPHELIQRIFLWTAPAALGCALQTCHDLNRLLETTNFWTLKLEFHGGAIPSQERSVQSLKFLFLTLTSGCPCDTWVVGSKVVKDGFFGKKKYAASMFGLDGGGKTCLLYWWHLRELVTTVPTIGFNNETLTHTSGRTMVVWDVGGQDKIRPLYRHYVQSIGHPSGTQEAFIFIVDTTDCERWKEVAVWLQELSGHIEDSALENNKPVLAIGLSKNDKPESQAAHVVLEAILPKGVPKGFRKAYAQTINPSDREDEGCIKLLDWIFVHVGGTKAGIFS